MLTHSAAATQDFARDTGRGAFTAAELARMGCTRAQLRARLAARRWQRHGTAIVLHNGELSREQRWDVGVINCGPRAVLASFSAAESLGLERWERDDVHVLAPAGVARPRLPGIPVVLHRARVIDPASTFAHRRCQRIAPALVLAASGFVTGRPGCGLLAAGVQQRLVTAGELRRAVSASANLRHHRLLAAAVNDIAMGAEALSEIDFARLCRRHGLPPPVQQAVRVERSGRRRYLDAEWRRSDGRRLVAEVDGAIHLAPTRWWDDQLRQNELTLTRSLVLRFPSVIVRTEPALVADQLRRGLFAQW